MNSILISKTQKEDVVKIVEFGLAADELQIDKTKRQYYGEDDLLKAISNEKNICLKATENGEIIGFILVLFHDYFREIYISDIYVKESHRGKGIGGKLLDEALKIGKEFDPQWKWALVQVENENMQKFLENKGMKKGEAFYFYYANEY